MAVGQADHFPYVHAHRVGDQAQFVREGDIDVAERVFGELGHLRGARARRDAGAAHEAAVKGERLPGAARRDAADDPIIIDQFDQDTTGQHPFGAIGDRDVGLITGASRYLQIGAQLGEQIAHFLGRTDGGGRFEDDRVTRLQHRRDTRRGLEDIADIGGMVVAERGGHRDHEDIGGRDRGRCDQVAARDDARYQAVEIDLLDMHLARVDGVDDALRDIDAEHLGATTCDHGGGGQADIAQSQNDDLQFTLRQHRHRPLAR